GYVILQSQKHVYASYLHQHPVPFKTTVRRQMYFEKGATASFHQANIEPGTYKLFLLQRKEGKNKLYCTGKTWVEK
ncbi:MAG TPA: hypothetical protein VGN64_14050, partial [Dyadobacter sp.]|nr:hypothetical protein [Dyadobacter sp.]